MSVEKGSKRGASQKRAFFLSLLFVWDFCYDMDNLCMCVGKCVCMCMFLRMTESTVVPCESNVIRCAVFVVLSCGMDYGYQFPSSSSTSSSSSLYGRFARDPN